MQRSRAGGSLALYIIDRQQPKNSTTAAEVVSSNPTRSTFINLVEYGIKLRVVLVIVGQKA
ncbi:MAG: hypothetical protein M3275_07450 [Thermoproteota archaeon]|nr:hypothetical protein [Thermoproteota archaeon]